MIQAAEIDRPRAKADSLTASPSEGLCGEIEVPGDKSVSHRALIIGALASGRTDIHGLLESEDVLRTAHALRHFGIDVGKAAGRWTVRGGEFFDPDREIHCGNSGTTARLMLGAMASFAIEADFTGDRSLQRRPMDRVLKPLKRMGLRMAPPKARFFPVRVRGRALHGITHWTQVPSAQVKSAVLLAGLRAEGRVEVIEPVPSRDHSERMLRLFGCAVEARTHEGRHLVALGRNRELRAQRLHVPGDPSSAAFPLVAALIARGSRITLSNVMVNPLRTGLITTLLEMGADLQVRETGLCGAEPVAGLTAASSTRQAVRVPASRAPSMIDEYPILAVAAAFAQGVSVFQGLGELRVKESDRLDAIVGGLRACGIRCDIQDDDLLVEGAGGRVPGGCTVRTHGDHRIAMAFLVLGLGAGAPVEVDHASMIATSFPGFAGLMRSLGADVG
jgi:3-phosphoshikimate 1-carboxyvinyltransferase